MTNAPADLLVVRQYLLRSTGLAGDAVGIVGGPDHMRTGGYHIGNDDLARIGRLTGDYSKRESARDRSGTNAASALDIGDFRRGGVTLRSVSLGLVAACQRGDPRTADVREVIYTPDGSSVRRFDRLGIRSTGDSSHLIHTHISFFRDSEGRRARADNILGLLAELIEGDDMGGEIADRILHNTIQVDNVTYSLWRRIAYGDDPLWSQMMGGRQLTDAVVPGISRANLASISARLDAMDAGNTARDNATAAAIKAMAAALSAGGGSIDAAPILARIDAVAAAESAAVAQLHAELASTRQEAALLRERLAAALDPDRTD